MNQAQKDKLNNILEEVLGIKPTPDISMDNVANWDSLRHIQLLAKIEQAFGIEIYFQDTLAMKNIKAIGEILDRYVARKPGSNKN